MDYQINFANYRDHFSLPRLIVDGLQETPADYLKIVLMIFQEPGRNCSTQLLARLLELPEETVEAGIDYWIGRRVLLAGAPADSSARPEQKPAAAKPAPAQPESERELRFLIREMEQLLQRPLTSTDLKTVTYLYEYYRLPADVILMAIQYAVDGGRRDIRYIERVCIGWYEQGMTTHAEVEAFFQRKAEYKSWESQVRTLLGIRDRKLIPSEEKWLHTWQEEYQYGLDVLQLAYERTVKHTGRAALAYMNKILSNWHKKGLRTLEEIQQKDSGKKPAPSGQSYDLDLLERYWDQVPTLEQEEQS